MSLGTLTATQALYLWHQNQRIVKANRDINRSIELGELTMSSKMVYVCDICKKETESNMESISPLVQVHIKYPILVQDNSVKYNTSIMRDACLPCFNEKFSSLGIKALTHKQSNELREKGED